MMERYVEFAVQTTVELLAIDSPSGYTEEAMAYVQNAFRSLGYSAELTRKGGVIADLGGKAAEDAIVLAAHGDTLGAMVTEIKSNGRLRIENVGGLSCHSIECENCRVVTKFNGIYEGTFQICNPSVHINPEFESVPRKYSEMEVVLDEIVGNAEETRALGIMPGDFVCFDPRTRVTEKGYFYSFI